MTTTTTSPSTRRKKKDKNYNVHFSSAKAEWATPQPLFNYLNSLYAFTLDPCCTPETAKCKKFFTQKEDGLKQEWHNDVVFMNPPYGRKIGVWMKKAYEESLKGATVVCLIPSRTDTQWWSRWCLKAHSITFITGRIKFVENGKELKAGAPFPSAIIVFHAKYCNNERPRVSWQSNRSMMLPV